MARDERWLLKLAEVEKLYDLDRDPLMQAPPISLDKAGEDARSAHARLREWLARLPRDADVPFDNYRGQRRSATRRAPLPPLRFAVDDSFGWRLVNSNAGGACFVVPSANVSRGPSDARSAVAHADVSGGSAFVHAAMPMAVTPAAEWQNAVLDNGRRVVQTAPPMNWLVAPSDPASPAAAARAAPGASTKATPSDAGLARQPHFAPPRAAPPNRGVERTADARESCGVLLNAIGSRDALADAIDMASRLRYTLEPGAVPGARRLPARCATFGVALFTDAELIAEHEAAERAPRLRDVFETVTAYNATRPPGFPWSRSIFCSKGDKCTAADVEAARAQDRAAYAASTSVQQPELSSPTKTMSAKTAMHYDHTIWLKRIEAARASPFSVTLWLDNDAYPCVGGVNALWRQLAAHVDVVAAVAKEKFGGTGKASWYPGAPKQGGFVSFPERNLGTVLVASSRSSVRRMLAEYEATFVRQTSDMRYYLHGDQPAFREALFRASVEWPAGERVRHAEAPTRRLCRLSGSCGAGCWFVHKRKAVHDTPRPATPCSLDLGGCEPLQPNHLADYRKNR